MIDVENELNKIRDEIYNINTNVKDSSDLYLALSKVNSLEEELHEVLILMYSNYQSELHALKHHHLVHISKLIDSTIVILNEVKLLHTKLDDTMINASKKIKKDTGKPSILADIFNKIPGFAYGAVVIAISIAIVWTLYHFDKKAADDATNTIATINKKK